MTSTHHSVAKGYTQIKSTGLKIEPFAMVEKCFDEMNEQEFFGRAYPFVTRVDQPISFEFPFKADGLVSRWPRRLFGSFRPVLMSKAYLSDNFEKCGENSAASVSTPIQDGQSTRYASQRNKARRPYRDRRLFANRITLVAGLDALKWCWLRKDSFTCEQMIRSDREVIH